MTDLRRPALVALIALSLASCRGGVGGTPTLTSEDVLETARAIAEQTRSAVTPTASTVPETATPTVPAPTGTPPASATPNVPTAVASYNVSVRSGPGEAYPIVDLFLEGQAGQIIGRFDESPIGTWWLILRVGQGINGWVWSGATEVSGETVGVPVLEAPEIPEPTDSA